MPISENPGLFRRFFSLFLRNQKNSATGRRWIKEFGKIEKLVEAKDFQSLEPALDDLYAWIGNVQAGKDIQPEWLNQTGLIYQTYAGEFTRAEECYRRALLLAEKTDDVHEKALAMTNLGVLFLDQNRSGEAVEMFTRLKPLIESGFGHESRETATAGQNLAAAYRMDGREEEAKAQRIESTRILRKLASS